MFERPLGLVPRSLVWLVSLMTNVAVILTMTPMVLGDESTVDFGRDVLPILSDKCFQCHGPDEANREAGLRLDQQESAFAELDSGEYAIVVGDRHGSAALARMLSDDGDVQMPPPDSGKSLTDDEIDVVGRWIEEGATWSKHWAYVTPVRPVLPSPVNDWAAQNEIDRFVHARLASTEMFPSTSADRQTLIRRVSLDIRGLPPTVEEVDEFLADKSPDAYARLVDRLLDSPRYGEHMARLWLDAARYADTHGLHLDNERSIWPYRRWVVDAFNRNLPFDRFTVEQLAGDLLPDPTLDQQVATGFNRCNVTTSEGGSIDDEYYVRYAVDRVETTSTVWLGMTAGCAACHDHKFDPLTQKQFYELFSYFFSLTEKAMDGNALLPPPAVKVPGLVQRRKRQHLSSQLQFAQQAIDQRVGEIGYVDPLQDQEFTLPISRRHETVWIDDQLPSGAQPSGDGDPAWEFVEAPEHPVLSGRKSSRRTAEGLSQHVFTDAEPGLPIGSHDLLFAYVYLDPENPPKTIQLQFNNGSWEHRAYWGEDKAHGKGKSGAANYRVGDLPEPGKWVRLEVPAAAVGLHRDAILEGWAFTQFGGTVYWDRAGKQTVEPLADSFRDSLTAWEAFRQQVRHPALPTEVQAAMEVPRAERAEDQRLVLLSYFLQQIHPQHTTVFAPDLARIVELETRIKSIDGAVPSSLVMKDRDEPRQAHVLERGEYTLPRDAVEPRVPEWIAPLPDQAPSNRLGLAQWLTDGSHPLTARVTVNRFWQYHFGTGLVKTAGDFGLQGEYPSHADLLDWLACEFVESGWDVKRLHRLILTSATYQQSSVVTPQHLELDPENRLLAHGPRYRLDAEEIRDQALAISGLMVGEIGGKSVKPYQPEGLWKPVGFGGSNTSVFKQDTGQALYRRSMYTFWKRTSPPPSMSTFDAPNRETCAVRRARTNTPLQSLVLMNDVQFFEAARQFAQRLLARQPDLSDEDRVVYAFRSVTSRTPHRQEIASLVALLGEYRSRFSESASAAEELLSVGETPRDDSFESPELAAWTMITHVLLNLHETVTKG